MAEKKVIIVGAGIAGLSAGSYLQMNGYKTEIFELHDIPGGLCTSWKRKGFTFDGCIHWLVGSSPSNSLHELWEELGAVQGKTMIDFDEYTRIEYEPGKFFTVYTDADRLEAEMKRVAPEDSQSIDELIRGIKTAASVNLPVGKARELYNALDFIKFVSMRFPLVRLMAKYGKVSLDEYVKKLKSPVLRQVIPTIAHGRFPLVVLMMMLSWMHMKSAGYPIGGSLEFARTIEKTYLGLGGKINYHAKVCKVLVKDDKAVGIKLENGQEHAADTVISAADGHYTIFEMLGGKYVDQGIRDNYDYLELFEPIFQVSFGIGRAMDSVPHSVNFIIDKPIMIDPKHTLERIPLRIFNFDPTMAPEGRTAATTIFTADYEYWDVLRKQNPSEYRAEKDRIAAEVIEVIDQKLGNIKAHVEVCDVATPATYVRYTNNWRASWEGWLPTPQSFMKAMRKTLPGLDNFYMVGQWVAPGGGVPNGLITGRDVTQLICKRDRKKFHTAT